MCTPARIRPHPGTEFSLSSSAQPFTITGGGVFIRGPTPRCYCCWRRTSGYEIPVPISLHDPLYEVKSYDVSKNERFENSNPISESKTDKYRTFDSPMMHRAIDLSKAAHVVYPLLYLLMEPNFLGFLDSMKEDAPSAES